MLSLPQKHLCPEQKFEHYSETQPLCPPHAVQAVPSCRVKAHWVLGFACSGCIVQKSCGDFLLLLPDLPPCTWPPRRMNYFLAPGSSFPWLLGNLIICAICGGTSCSHGCFKAASVSRSDSCFLRGDILHHRVGKILNLISGALWHSSLVCGKSLHFALEVFLHHTIMLVKLWSHL